MSGRPDLAQLVAELGRQAQLVVMLRYAEELTHEETAAVLGIPPHEVRSIERLVVAAIECRLHAKPK